MFPLLYPPNPAALLVAAPDLNKFCALFRWVLVVQKRELTENEIFSAGSLQSTDNFFEYDVYWSVTVEKIRLFVATFPNFVVYLHQEVNF